MNSDRDLAAAYVQVRRRHLGMTQQQLAQAADLDIKTVSNLETGRRWPRDKSLARLERALRLEQGSLKAMSEGGKAVPLADDPSSPPRGGADHMLMAEIADLTNLTKDDVDMLRRFWAASRDVILDKARAMNDERAGRDTSKRKGA